MRVSLLAVFAIVTFAALVCWVVAQPLNTFAVVSLSTFRYALLCFATLKAIISKEQPMRSFWLGVCVFGWPYVLMEPFSVSALEEGLPSDLAGYCTYRIDL